MPLPGGRDLVQRWTDEIEEMSSVELEIFAQEEERTEAKGRGGMRGEGAPAAVKAARGGSQWGEPGRGVVTPQGRTLAWGCSRGSLDAPALAWAMLSVALK